MEQGQKEDATPARALRPDPFKTLAEKSKSLIDMDTNWLITLSDVLSLLLVFFVMFIVIARATTTPATPVGDSSPNATSSSADHPMTDSTARDRILDEMNSEIKNLDLENDVSVHAVDKEIVITLKEKVTFRPGEALTLKSSEPILDKIALTLRQYPDFRVEIDGHTDNVPIKTPLFPSNWELSVARAASVLKYFIDHHGINPSRFSIKGNADQMPVASNDTPEDRAQNRRVEIRLRQNAN
ncbi:MAG TPA: flagellar motor protein MotB [Nitrospiria bacterium]|nr:flagellar motor protein MotB [Nitrospiria bacterium]